MSTGLIHYRVLTGPRPIHDFLSRAKYRINRKCIRMGAGLPDRVCMLLGEMKTNYLCGTM